MNCAASTPASQMLEQQLASIGAGGVEPLRQRQCLHQISEPGAAAQPPRQAFVTATIGTPQRAFEEGWNGCVDAMLAAQAAPAAVAGPSREFTDGTRTLRQDCISAIRDFASMRPEEGETWESWFEAAFDMCQQRLAGIFDEHTAAPQPPAEAQEPVAILHDDGYWTPTKTEAGRQLNERLMQAGSRVEVYAHQAPQQPAPEYIGNGMFKGESIQQAAASWANWCDVRCLGGLSEFLRVVSAQQPAPTTEQAGAPTLWASMEQLRGLLSRPDPEESHGRYLPVRLQSAGKFTTPLFSASAPDGEAAPAPGGAAPVAQGDAEVLSMSQALFAKREADARDAARYRWLRDFPAGEEGVRDDLPHIAAGGNYVGAWALHSEEADAAIDAARAQAQQGGTAQHEP